MEQNTNQKLAEAYISLASVGLSTGPGMHAFAPALPAWRDPVSLLAALPTLPAFYLVRVPLSVDAHCGCLLHENERSAAFIDGLCGALVNGSVAIAWPPKLLRGVCVICLQP